MSGRNVSGFHYEICCALLTVLEFHSSSVGQDQPPFAFHDPSRSCSWSPPRRNLNVKAVGATDAPARDLCSGPRSWAIGLSVGFSNTVLRYCQKK